ncbi:MAG: hypothetical protein BA870_00115 [Desulfuromonadales bacterium C00003094]|nr:MAG: hypothetical protein BA870_00115 [Desulfuromonadales bacterium C00003094]
MIRGTIFGKREVIAKAKMAVLGQAVVDELFAGQDPIGQRIRVRKTPFQVIGVLAKKGQNGLGDDQVDVILMSVGFTLAEGVFFGVYPARKAAGLNPIDALRHE